MISSRRVAVIISAVFGTWLGLTVVSGCRSEAQPIHLIVLIDVSGSIDRDALSDTFVAVNRIATHLNRGDRFTIVPILPDAMLDSSGRILRFSLPLKREAYDVDLVRVREEIAIALARLNSTALNHPGGQTDILGAIGVAGEEARSGPPSKLIIFSDFIEDDGRLDFKKSPRLSDEGHARKFAQSITSLNESRKPFRAAYLGLLRSKDLRTLDFSRRQAIEIFWKTYIVTQADNTQFATDAAGLNSRFE